MSLMKTSLNIVQFIQDGGALFFCILGKIDLYSKTFKKTFKISLGIASLNFWCDILNSKCTCFYGITILFWKIML